MITHKPFLDRRGACGGLCGLGRDLHQSRRACGLTRMGQIISIAPEQGDPMSKALVKETDEEADLLDELPAIPPGIKNYMTPEVHRHVQNELRQLLRVERPKIVETVAWAAGNGDRSENGDYIYGKRRLREIDRRFRFLSKRLEHAEVVDPSQQKHLNQVFSARPSPMRPGAGPK